MDEPGTSKQALPAKSKKVTDQDILDALKKCNGNQTEAAKQLGVSRKHINEKVKELDAKPDVPKEKRCGICWGEWKGVGNVYSTQPITNSNNKRRYYRCDACGHTWNADIDPAGNVVRRS